ncbi:hypothetical protein DICPUDRAFT_82056 [Dictyostelium purpureum]|uniref:Prolyl 4-hydroxylase alpha subunit Fe(2+) 2OG dioxygenase domain-containing protein n=1 Tax=Dictyostelium purpureum TaxID=5786 RepID=F0ZVD9_DICPU|nr:uncharacterized protein DICPUDRAFT_82056 [Dictyostelium purpureum]EGC32098.1 hypothetical protein DICPUDRAFT_82056 [Dictyostelium purpureum]|eukprot:XP_003291387.1 hypothetical protein DICPUDRAFT_82056 [Dictyostelium purpureum]
MTMFANYNKKLIKLEELLKDAALEKEVNKKLNYNFQKIENQNIMVSIKDFGYLSFPCSISQTRELIDKHVINNKDISNNISNSSHSNNSSLCPMKISNILNNDNDNDNNDNNCNNIINNSNNESNVWKIYPDLVSIESKSWSSTLEMILNDSKKKLDMSEDKIVLQLNKMLIFYNGGSEIQSRREIEEEKDSSNIVGTLLVILQSYNQGGQLIIKHGDQFESIDLGSPKISSIQYAVFGNDYSFEVKPTPMSHRFCLVYNLVKTGKRYLSRDGQLKNNSTPLKENRNRELEKEMNAQLEENGKLAYVLSRKYNSFKNFNDEDKKVLDRILSIEKSCNLLVLLAKLCVIETNEIRISSLHKFLDQKNNELDIEPVNIKLKKEVLPQNSIKEVFSISNKGYVASVLVIIKKNTSGKNKPIILGSYSFEVFPSAFDKLLRLDRKNNIETDTDENLELLDHYHYQSPNYIPTLIQNPIITNLVHKYLPSKDSRIKRLLFQRVGEDSKLFLNNLKKLKPYYTANQFLNTLNDIFSKLPEDFLQKIEIILNTIDQKEIVYIFKNNPVQLVNYLEEILSSLDKDELFEIFKSRPKEFIQNIGPILKKTRFNKNQIMTIFNSETSNYNPGEMFNIINQNRAQSPIFNDEFIIHYIKLNQSFFLPTLKNNTKDIKNYIEPILDIFPDFINSYKETIDNLIDKHTLSIDIINPKPLNASYYKLLLAYCSILGRYNNQLKELKIKLQLSFSKLLCDPMEEMVVHITTSSPLKEIWDFIYSNGNQYLVESYCQGIQLKFFNKLIQVFRIEDSIDSSEVFEKLVAFIQSSFNSNKIPEFIKNIKFFNFRAFIGFLEVVMNLYIRMKIKSYSINIKFTCTHRLCNSCPELNNFFKCNWKRSYQWCDLGVNSEIKTRELLLFLKVHSNLLRFEELKSKHNKKCFLIEKEETCFSKLVTPFADPKYSNNLSILLKISKICAPDYFIGDRIKNIENVLLLNK